jgi:urease accessory protein
MSAMNLTVERVGERSVITRAHARTPLRLLQPSNHGHAAWVYQSSHGGGFVGADEIALEVEVEPGATLFLSSQASTKVYRASNSRCTVDARVGAGGTLVSWPDPIVCFAGARFSQHQRFSLDPTANLVCVDAFTAGRVAAGERWAFDELSLRLSVAIGGEARLAEAQLLSPRHGDLAARLHPFAAFATAVLAGPGLERSCDRLHGQIAGRSLEDETLIVSSRWPWGLLVRVAAPAVEPLTHSLRALLRPLLPELLGDDPLERKW